MMLGDDGASEGGFGLDAIGGKGTNALGTAEPRVDGALGNGLGRVKCLAHGGGLPTFRCTLYGCTVVRLYGCTVVRLTYCSVPESDTMPVGTITPRLISCSR